MVLGEKFVSCARDGFGAPEIYFVTIFGGPKVHYIIVLNSLDRPDLLQESPFVYNFGQLPPLGRLGGRP